MVVRVRVQLSPSKGKGVVETSAMVNTGFESTAPELVLPEKLARRLGILTRGKVKRVDYVGAAGKKLKLVYIPGALELKLLAGDVERGPVAVSALVSEGETEVLLSDKLAEAVGIAIEAPGQGLWRLRDEPPEKVRRSSQPEEW